MNLSTGQENVIKFYKQLKSRTSPLNESDNAEPKVAMFNIQYTEAIKGNDNDLETYLKENVTYEKTNEPPENNKFHPYTITINVTDAEGTSEKKTLIINDDYLKETVETPGGGKTRKGGRKHKRKQRKSAKRKSSRKRKTK